MVNPKLIIERAVRTQAIRVRSDAMEVRRRAISSEVSGVRSVVIAELFSVPCLDPHDATEPDVAGRRVDGLGEACRRAIASAVVRCAKMRPALDHFARNLDVRLARIVALIRLRAAWIERHAAG